MQNPKDSIKYYKKAIEIDANLSDVHYNLGNALYLVEKIDDAIHHYQRAIKLNPKKPESFYNLFSGERPPGFYLNLRPRRKIEA